MEKNKIVTYSCSDIVYVYQPKCGFIPAFPYMVHKNVESGINYLKEIGKENIKVKTYKTLDSRLA